MILQKKFTIIAVFLLIIAAFFVYGGSRPNGDLPGIAVFFVGLMLGVVGLAFLVFSFVGKTNNYITLLTGFLAVVGGLYYASYSMRVYGSGIIGVLVAVLGFTIIIIGFTNSIKEDKEDIYKLSGTIVLQKKTAFYIAGFGLIFGTAFSYFWLSEYWFLNIINPPVRAIVLFGLGCIFIIVALVQSKKDNI